METSIIYNEDCLETMSRMPRASIDLVVTSPPYDNLRDYEGYTFDFPLIAKELFRIMKPGGVVVWIIGDATIKGSETGTSFKQALGFKEVGFKLHDTMIWDKGGFSAVGSLQCRYAPVFDYMFIFSKQFIGVFNPIKDRKTKHGGKIVTGTKRQADGSTKPMSKTMFIQPFSQRFNIWSISPERSRVGHPAPFPEILAADHIKSWSPEDALVYDPLAGSGTTLLASANLNRRFIGSEVSAKYCQTAKRRLAQAGVECRIQE